MATSRGIMTPAVTSSSKCCTPLLRPTPLSPPLSQAIEEIETRRQRRKKEQAALNRARAAAVLAVTSTTALSAPLPAPASSPPVGIDQPSSSSPPLPSDANDEKSRKPLGTPGDARPETESKFTLHRAAAHEPLILPEPAIRVDGGIATGPPTTAAAKPAALYSRMADREPNSTAALHKASSTFGLKTTASASRLGDQYTPPCPAPTESNKQKKKEEALAVMGGDNKKRIATYANMAVEVCASACVVRDQLNVLTTYVHYLSATICRGG